MKIPYNKIRTLSTVELPGVVCDPTLTFDFIANPSFELMKDISLWIKNPEWQETKRLATELIKAVIVPGGERWELGTLESIQELADQTEDIFIGNVINGWQTRISVERMTELKKSSLLLGPLSETSEEKSLVLESVKH